MGIEITNWSSFTAAEILELKKEGVEVPSDIYKMAKSTYEEVTVSEEDINSYELVDTSSQVNEAQELLEKLLADMGGEGDNFENLEQIAKVFISKSGKEQKTVLKDLAEMDKLSKEIEETQDEAERVQEEAQEDIDTLLVEQEELQAKVESGTITEDEQERLDYINGVISGITSDANTKTENLTSELKKIGAKISNVAIRAGNAKETGDTTADVGKKLQESNEKELTLGGKIGLGFFGADLARNVICSLVAVGKGIFAGASLVVNPLGMFLLAGSSAAVALFNKYGQKNTEQTDLNLETGDKAVKAGKQLSGFAEQSQGLAQKAAENNNFTIVDIEGNKIEYELNSESEEFLDEDKEE